MKVSDFVSLSEHTSFRIGGKARFFAEVQSVEELKQVISSANQAGLPYIVLGEGTNVLMSDDDFPGYVIRPKIMGIDLQTLSPASPADKSLIVAGAGEHWDDLVAFSVSKDLSGLENLSFIPGSVGAAPVQNIGAYGAELGDVLVWVEVCDPKTGEVKKLSKAECRLEYRDSLFKSPEGRDLIITRIAVELTPNGIPNISYKDLVNYFSANAGGQSASTAKKLPTIAEVRDAVISIRQAKLPDVAKLGTVGSFFKNPIITEAEYARLAEKFPGLPSFPAEVGFKKIPLAWILDKVCGLNGFRDGMVGLFETQPLALVNFGGATASDVKKFAQKISDIVKEKTGIEIEWEVNKK